jgi:eukaryotic-like serine/threonine-protein kinase
MATPDPDRWALVQDLLDEALTMPESQREAWLGSLHAGDPALASELEALLQEHRAVQDERFLERFAPPRPDVFDLAGQRFGAYTLLSPIADGGMGRVWLAERADGRFDRRVAVKLLRIALPGAAAARFTREGQILARLTHPHVAQLIDAGISPHGQPYLVLEYVDGAHIDRHCDDRAMGVDARVRLFLDVLSAVAHAHANLVVHRDIKPSNVLVTPDGRVVLLDFGVAKLLEDEAEAGAATMLTREGGAALTPAYAAPEQLTGGPISTATDVYALGVLLFVLLTGRHPTGDARTPADLMRAIVEADAPRAADATWWNRVGTAELAESAARRATTPDRLRRQLRGDLETIARTALKKAPAERYASVTAMADDLRRYLEHEAIGARPDTLAYRASRFVRRNRLAVAFGAAAALATAVGLAGTVLQARTARAERDFALHALARAEALNDLDTFLLSDAAPPGQPITIDGLLARAEHVVGRQRADPASRSDLLVAIGRQYAVEDEDGRARRVLEAAYSLSRGLADPSTRARAACGLASAVAKGGDLRRAEALFQSGVAELPAGPQYAVDRLFCLQRGTEVALGGGGAREAIDRARAAQRVLREAPVRSDLLEVRVLMNLSEALRAGGRQREAVPVYEQAAARLSALGRDDTARAGTLFNNWALALNQLGRVAESERIYRRAIAVSRADGTDRAVSPMLLVNYSRVLLDLGRADEAADYATRAHEKAVASDDEVVVNQSLLMLALISRARGDLARAETLLAEVEPRLRRALPPGHIAFGSVASYRSLVAQSRGDLAGALVLADRAVAIVDESIKAGRQGADLIPTLLVRRADVEIGLGRPDAAEADGRRAVGLLRAGVEPGTFSVGLGRAYGALGRALLAKGRSDEGRAALREAAEHIGRALGPDAPEARRARGLASGAG